MVPHLLPPHAFCLNPSESSYSRRTLYGWCLDFESTTAIDALCDLICSHATAILGKEIGVIADIEEIDGVSDHDLMRIWNRSVAELMDSYDLWK